MKILPLIFLLCWLLLAGCSSTTTTQLSVEAEMMKTKIIEAQSGTQQLNEVISGFQNTIQEAKEWIQQAEETKAQLHKQAEASRARLKAYWYEIKESTKKEDAMFSCLKEDWLTYEKVLRDEVDNYDYIENTNVFEWIDHVWVRKSDGANCYRSEIIR